MSKREREPTTVAAAPNTEANAGSSIGVYSSNAPSAHAIGICSMAIRSTEDRMVVAREDGSLAVCKVRPNPVRFTAAIVPLIRTGSFEGRTVTRILYALGGSVVVAAYLSGQIVVYDEATLTPLFVAERVGGAIWDMCSVRGDKANPEATEEEFVCACADGSWYHFILVRGANNNFQLNLVQVFPKVVGANRALSVALCGDMLVGTDDCGNVVAWSLPAKGVRGYNQLWLSRLPKGGYGKSVAYDAETNYVVVGTSLGDVAFLRGEKGDIVNMYTNHQGPITSVTSAGARTMVATGWHESLRAYRFVEGKWIPSEVRRRTHYHEATQLLHLASANAVIGSSRDGTLLIASLQDHFNSPPKYVQPAPQPYAYAAEAAVVLTVAGSRVEMYQGNEAMSHWAPLAVYTAHGNQGIRGVWCNAALTRVVVATTTRLVVLGCSRKSTSSITLSKLHDVPYANTHAVLLDGDSDCYVVHGMGKLSHLSFGGSSIIETHVSLGIKATSVGKLGGEKALLVASFVATEAPLKVLLNDDGSFASPKAEPVEESLRADSIISDASIGLATFNNRFFHIGSATGEYKPLPSSVPADAVFFAKLTGEGAAKPMWMGYFPRGLIIATLKSWWLADEDHRGQKALDAEALSRSTAVALSNGPRTTFIAAFGAEDRSKVLVLRRDIESEVETLPLMWKVRRFGN